MSAAPRPETPVWSDSPSQWLNAGVYALAILMVILAMLLSATVKLGYTAPLEKAGVPSSGMLVFCALWSLGAFLWAFWHWLVLKCTRYQLTSQRLMTSSGVLNKLADEMELYRVKDYRVEQPFLLRIFGLGHIVLVSSDKITKHMTLHGVADPLELASTTLRPIIEECRDRKRVREID